jgi:hypothetical protein
MATIVSTPIFSSDHPSERVRGITILLVLARSSFVLVVRRQSAGPDA